jgi:iron(III) transport system substrate-binding protein
MANKGREDVRIGKRIRSAAAALMIANVAVTFGAANAFAADQALIDAAVKEGKVVWYSTLIMDTILKPLMDAFQAKYPQIKVEGTRMDNPTVFLRLINEGRAGASQADVFDVSSSIDAVKKAGLVDQYNPPAAAKFAPEYRDPDGYWTVTHIVILGTSINTNLVKGDDIPKSWADLLDPKWKGKMAWPAATTNGGGPFIANILATMGEDAGMEYLRKLSKQDVVNVAESPIALLDHLSAGEYAIQLMAPTHLSQIVIKKGAPVARIDLEPMLMVPYHISKVKEGPHPNAAKLLIDFLLSDEGQEVYQKAGYIPVNPNIKPNPPELRPDMGHFKVNVYSPEPVETNFNRWVEIYNQLFK